MRYVIIGVGAAGITAAKTIRACEADADIVMISQDNYVHSRCMLHRFISGERTEDGLNFAGEDFFEKNNIYWIKDTIVTRVDTKEKEVYLQDQRIAYDKLLIATGANSFMPPVGDFRTADNVFGLRHLSDAQNICNAIKENAKVLVVGSGLVGLDAAYALLERKLDVTVVEMAERILPIQLDDTAAKAYQDLFEEAGCKFYLGRKASETVLDKDNNIEAVILDDGTKIACDVIIVAAGVRPAIACVEESGIQAERFIEVNEYMETSASGVYAAGDVTGRSGIWPNAQKQGQTAGYNMCGIKTQYLDTYAMKNTINFYGLATLSLGRGQVQEGDKVVVCEDSKEYKKAIIRAGKLDSITLQGDMDYSGIYQYLIKNQIALPENGKDVFHLSFADFYGVEADGQYTYSL
ncbi:MAG: FAD-dependent oxidoreductase [Lachnospiraceae bacterium]|jgi:nitrite reductase (NADH) large subunit|nr:FAD-dependent oxidoreductase [Lachnospiraceae bacterium]MDD3617525.1 FAD-dependent oxidoreductase [Lachnospiraceae bacterium]